MHKWQILSKNVQNNMRMVPHLKQNSIIINFWYNRKRQKIANIVIKFSLQNPSMQISSIHHSVFVEIRPADATVYLLQLVHSLPMSKGIQMNLSVMKFVEDTSVQRNIGYFFNFTHFYLKRNMSNNVISHLQMKYERVLNLSQRKSFCFFSNTSSCYFE